MFGCCCGVTVPLMSAFAITMSYEHISGTCSHSVSERVSVKDFSKASEVEMRCIICVFLLCLSSLPCIEMARMKWENEK